MAEDYFQKYINSETYNKSTRDVVSNTDWNGMGDLNKEQGNHSETWLEKIYKYLFGATTTFDTTVSNKMADVTANTNARHSHDNFDTIDEYTQSETDLADAVDKKHSHEHMTAIESITQDDIDSWDSKTHVEVSNSGTATDTVGYIKIGTTWYKMVGSGSGGTTEYPDLQNKPKIAGITLVGDKSLADLGIASASSVSGLVHRTVTLDLDASAWQGSASPYSINVSSQISGRTANTKVDLQPDASVITQMLADDTKAFYVSNNNGTLTCYAVGECPTADLEIQATYYEVNS